MNAMTDIEAGLAAWSAGLDEKTRQRALNALAGPVDEDGQPLGDEEADQD